MTKSAIVKTISGVTAASAVTIPSAYLANKHLQEKGKEVNINEDVGDGLDRKGKNERDVIPKIANSNIPNYNECAGGLQAFVSLIKKDFTKHFENGSWEKIKEPRMPFSDAEKTNFSANVFRAENWRENSSAGCISKENKAKVEENISKIKDFFKKVELERFKSEVVDPLRDILRMSGIKGWEGLL